MEKNIFGGNKNSLYIPMSETEMEVLERIRDDYTLEVVIVGWGVVKNPRIIFGDLRLSVPLNILFDKPDVHIPLYYLDLELRLENSDIILYKNREPTTTAGLPLMVGSGVQLVMAWDIAIKSIDPNLIRMINPHTRGLTTRRGNMQMSEKQKEADLLLEQQESRIKKFDQDKLKDLAKKSLLP